MKESEFIELLNLYVDHEISVEDATRLEAEVAANPARRSIYRQYCCIHKACTLLADQFRELAPEAQPIHVRRPAPVARWAAGTAFGGLALAACVAVVLAVHSRTGAPGNSGPAGLQLAAAQAPSTAQADTVSAPGDGTSRDLIPVLALRDFSQFSEGPSAPEALTAASAQSPGAPLAWIQRLQLQALQQASAVRPDYKPSATLALPDVRANRPAADEQNSAELSAFRFER